MSTMAHDTRNADKLFPALLQYEYPQLVIARALADEREATIDAVLRILNASERDYAWLRQRVRDERAK